MGWTPVGGRSDLWFTTGNVPSELLHYSTNIASAMLVEDRIVELKLEREYAGALARLAWNAYASTEVNLMYWHVAHAIPRMRCLAALAAMEDDK